MTARKVEGEGEFYLPVPVAIGDTLSVDMEYGDYIGQAVVISCEQTSWAIGDDRYLVKVRFELAVFPTFLPPR